MSRPNTKPIKEFYPDVEGARDLGEHDTLLSIAKARRLLGYRPGVQLVQRRNVLSTGSWTDSETEPATSAQKIR